MKTEWIKKYIKANTFNYKYHLPKQKKKFKNIKNEMHKYCRSCIDEPLAYVFE